MVFHFGRLRDNKTIVQQGYPMPELPEVEVCRLSLLPALAGQRVTGVRTSTKDLRQPLPAELHHTLAGRRIVDIIRRGKYLLFDCRRGRQRGWLIIHLGMSGNLHFVPAGQAPGRHDHFDLLTNRPILRFTDPRRFGLILWHDGADPEGHPLLAGLGIEPLSEEFSGKWLYRAFRQRSAPVKNVLMDARTIAGIGNIYASESLFRAGISPLRAANRVSLAACLRLAKTIRETLQEAISAGGSSIRDYRHSDGGSGCFQLEYAVYGREHQPCPRCGGTVRKIRQAGRSSYYCPGCQK
ncbi:MAG: Formamidopyrimidine-DNA glycosylase [Betaproteobacteria bacterium ADurb.Bin341]|nr:MAG: Formamidopyrimidine-DNA glycosylase [Betaproteobacteria bacterium ADurb.Bin341]